MRKIPGAALAVALIFITSWVFAVHHPAPATHAVKALPSVVRVHLNPYELGG